MKAFNKYQALIFSFLVALLIVTPILSSSMRSTYLYFIINLVILALGAESGLLSFLFSKPPPPADHPDKKISSEATTAAAAAHQPKTIEKSVSEKVKATTVKVTVKKSPSMPSIFFIGGDGETDAAVGIDGDTAVEEELAGGDGINGQDQLFTKAETFIGNFYKQLQMQREDSWNRIHGFYKNAF